MTLPQASQGANSELFGIIWRRKLIVAFILVVGLGLGYLYFLRQVPVYRSSAQILIIRDQVKLPIEGLTVSASYDRTHETLIRSTLVIETAVKEQPEVASLTSMAGNSNVVGTIISGLRVTGDGGKNGDILKLDYESIHRDECPKVLEAVVKGYAQFLGATYKKTGDETVELIRKAIGELDQQLKDVKADYRKFQESSPLLTTGETSQNIHQARLQGIEQARAEHALSISQLKAQVESIESTRRRGASREVINLMVGKLNESEHIVTSKDGLQQVIEERIFPLMLQELELTEKNNYGPDHPQVKMIRKHIELTRELLLGRAADGKTMDFTDVYLTSLREKIQVHEQTIKELTAQFEEEQRSSRQLASVQMADENFRSEIALKERLFAAVTSRLEELSLAKGSGGTRLELINPPTQASQVRPELSKIMIMAGILGTIAGFGLAYLVDSSDRRFRSPEEIRHDFGVPVFGHIPVIAEALEGRQKRANNSDGRTEIAPSLSVYHHSKGRIAEAYRGVRTGLFFSTRVSGFKVFQVTSPSPSDGKTTLVCNLAVATANAGKKILLIDADFRRPRVHEMFGVRSELGMSSVIEGTSDVADAIQPTIIDNLFVLPCGPKPRNPAELLSSRRFEELLSVLREKFDYVLIDSPPVLAVTDPLNVASRVDGVLLVMRLTKTARHNGRRALEALEGIGANILGVVVNGVGKTPGYGYDYGGYSYRDAYGNSYGYRGYTSGYRYGYVYGDDRSYYIDEDDGTNGRDVRPGAPVAGPVTQHGNGNGKS
jgi:capsular exopolysaccharide synthesis family protein